MWILAKSLKDLQFGKLMEVYAEGNRDNAAERYPQLSPEQGIAEAEQDFYAYLRSSFFQTPGAFYVVWQENGQYISALRLEPYRDGYLLEAVETRPDARRQGFAKKLLSSVLAQLEGKVYAHIAKWNEPSRRLHTGCGLRKISNIAVYIDGSVNDRCETYLWQKNSR